MSDKKYSKAEIAEMAETLRKLGSGDGDSILAHITKEEAAVLKARGGAGTKDPITGLPHFNSDNSTDNSEGKDQGPEGGESDNDNESNNQAASDRAREANSRDRDAVASEARRDKIKEAYGTGDPNEIANRTAEQIGGLGNYGTGKGQADLSKEVQPGEQYGGMRQKASSGWGAGITTGAVTLGLTGNPTLAAAAGKKAKAMATNDGTGWNLDTGSTNGPKPQGTVPDGGADGGNYFTPKKASSSPMPVAEETVDAAPDQNMFVAAPRKRKNYQSTVKAGNSWIEGTVPQGKHLLGS